MKCRDDPTANHAALHAPPPSPAPPPPFEWGRRDRVQDLLGSAFDLKFETGTTVLREPDGEAVWRLFSTGYGPTKTTPAGRREHLHRDLVAFHDRLRRAGGGHAA